MALNARPSTNETARRTVLEESLSFNLTYQSPVNDSELSKDVWALQNFLTFATDHPNAATRFEVHQDGDQSRIPLTVLGPPVFDDETAAEGLLEDDLIFGHSDVQGRFEDVIRRWFALAEKHTAAFAIYFGLKYNPPRYSDLRFQLMAQALSLYQTSGMGHQSVSILPHNFADTLDSSQRDALVRTHPLVVLAKTLRALTEQHQAVFDPLINAHDDESRVTFLEMTTQTFQYVLGREGGAPERAKGETYYWLMELLGFLWKISLLSDLGFSTAEQQRLFARNRLYRHIRDKIAPELFGRD